MCISNKLRILEFGADINIGRQAEATERQNSVTYSKSYSEKWKSDYMNLEAYKSQASICYAGTDAQWSPQVLRRLKEDPHPAGVFRSPLWAEEVPDGG